MKSLATLLKLCTLAIALVTSGCVNSLVYSPSLNLPVEPLKKEQGQVILGGLMLPETRPHQSDEKVKTGGEALLRYAFADNFALGVKGWTDFGIDKTITNENGTFTQPVAQRGGIALQGSFHLPASNGYRFAIIPTVAYLSAGNEFPAQGASVAFATWFPKLGVITPYTAVGPAIGFRNSNEWGYGAIVNLGAAMEIFTNITLNAEVAGIVQVNQYDNITHGVVSPSVSLGWTF